MDAPNVWDDYRRKRNLAWFALLGYVPVCFCVGVLSMRLFSTFTPALVVAIAWMVFFVIAGNLALRFPVRDVGSRSSKNGGITTALRGGVSTVDCRSMPTRPQKLVNERN